jgi:hypothetical protein
VYRALTSKQDIIESVLGRLSSRATAVR